MTRRSVTNAPVAQLVEQLTLNQLVEGSSPSGGTENPRCSRVFLCADQVRAVNLGAQSLPRGLDVRFPRRFSDIPAMRLEAFNFATSSVQSKQWGSCAGASWLGVLWLGCTDCGCDRAGVN